MGSVVSGILTGYALGATICLAGLGWLLSTGHVVRAQLTREGRPVARVWLVLLGLAALLLWPLTLIVLVVAAEVSS